MSRPPVRIRIKGKSTKFQGPASARQRQAPVAPSDPCLAVEPPVPIIDLTHIDLDAPGHGAASTLDALPMPPAPAWLRYERRLRPEEVAALRANLPCDDDVRWEVRADGHELSFYRSWTGFCIFKARIVERDGAAFFTDVLVNSDPDQYQREDDDVARLEVALEVCVDAWRRRGRRSG